MMMEKEVLLLAIYKKEEGETLQDIVLMLAQSKLFSVKEGKKLLKEIRKEELVLDGELTLKGIASAQRAETKFKL